jgi:hypothetical protein
MKNHIAIDDFQRKICVKKDVLNVSSINDFVQNVTKTALKSKNQLIFLLPWEKPV